MLSNINWAQWASLARTLIPFIGGALVMRGVVSATQFDSIVNQIGTIATDVTVLAGLAAPVATAVWGMFTHTDAAVVKAAASVPGTTVMVTPTVAPPAVVAVANDASVPNVINTTTQTPNAHP